MSEYEIRDVDVQRLRATIDKIADVLDLPINGPERIADLADWCLDAVTQRDRELDSLQFGYAYWRRRAERQSAGAASLSPQEPR